RHPLHSRCPPAGYARMADRFGFALQPRPSCGMLTNLPSDANTAGEQPFFLVAAGDPVPTGHHPKPTKEPTAGSLIPLPGVLAARGLLATAQRLRLAGNPPRWNGRK